MPTFLDKSATVALLHRVFAALGDLCRGLTDEQWATPTCLPGWTVQDVLSHVVGVESGLLGEPMPEVDVSHLTHLRNPIAEANEHWVERLRGSSGVEVLERFAEVTGRRLALLDALSQEEFDAPSWTPAGRDETYGRFMRIRHYDTYLHEHDIRAALGLPPREDPDEVASALDEVATGLGYIVGRRAALPDGTRVRLELTGPGARTFLVAVDGRAAVVESLAGPPTVGLTLPTSLFLRLTGGRADPGVDPDREVVVTGDDELGRRLVAHLAFTI